MEKSEIESYVKAGEIAKEVKIFVGEIVKRGVKLIDVAEAIDAKILELGGSPAFPVNLGLNEVAAHFTPASGDETIAEGILKIDLGVEVDGFIADTAISFDLTEDERFGDMIDLNKKILARAGEVVRVGMKVKDVGEAAQEALMDWKAEGDEREAEKLTVIKGLCGHALERNIIHTAPTVSNYRNDNEMVLSEVAFAIEPFVTSGVGDIFEGKGGGIYALKNDGQVRDRDARKVLEFVRENYKTRPFCARWLERGIRNQESGISGIREGKIKFVLGMLCRAGIISEYPILIETSRKPVSQFENTFVISGDEVVCTTE